MGVKWGYQNYFLGCNPILLVTAGRMQNFKNLAQPLLGEFGGGFLLLFLPHESKANSQEGATECLAPQCPCDLVALVFFILLSGGVIIGQVRLGQVHRPKIVFLPLLFR
jgi:hypothetical protein